MALSDGVFDVLIILAYLATPLAFSLAIYLQDRGWHVGWHHPVPTVSAPPPSISETAAGKTMTAGSQLDQKSRFQPPQTDEVLSSHAWTKKYARRGR